MVFLYWETQGLVDCDLPLEFLESIYDYIVANEIVMQVQPPWSQPRGKWMVS